MFSLKNKIIVVTGGNGLLGQKIIETITAQSGFCINLDIKGITTDTLDTIACNIADEQSVQNAIDLIIQKYGKIDGLVNCAYPRTSNWGKQRFEHIGYETWQQNVDLQMNSCFLLCQKISNAMLPNQSGSIINFGSIYGVVAQDDSIYQGTEMFSTATYAAIKGGVIQFTKYLSAYLGHRGIRANCISPGGIFDNQNPVFVANYENRVPMKRMGTAADIAPAVAFLLSDGASYITGQNLVIDGGWTAI